MSSRRDRKKIKLALILVSCFVFGLGYYILEVVSRKFEIPLGNTFYVILGCTLMAISALYILYTINYLFFTKRSKRTKHIYLKDNSKDPKSE